MLQPNIILNKHNFRDKMRNALIRQAVVFLSNLTKNKSPCLRLWRADTSLPLWTCCGLRVLHLLPILPNLFNRPSPLPPFPVNLWKKPHSISTRIGTLFSSIKPPKKPHLFGK